MEQTRYTIETKDGYRLEYVATDGHLVSAKPDFDFGFEDEAELLQWVADNIELISSYKATILADNIHGKR